MQSTFPRRRGLPVNFDKSTILAVVFCFLAYVGYETYLNNKYPDRFKVAVQNIENPSEADPKKVEKSSSHAPIPAVETPIYASLPIEDLRIENDTSIYTFDQKKGAIASIKLKDFQNSEHDAPIDLLNYPLEIYPTDRIAPIVSEGFAANRVGNSLAFSRQIGSWLLKHSYAIDEKGYGVTLNFHWKNNGSQTEDLKSVILMHYTMAPLKKEGFSLLPGMPTGHPFLVVAHTGDLERFDALKICQDAERKTIHSAENFNLSVLAFDMHYFIGSLLPQDQRTSYRILKTQGGENQDCSFTFFTENKQGLVKPGDEITITYKAWFGPKSTYNFGNYDPNLEKTLDLGFFARITHPLLAALHFLNKLVHNWGLAIIILTIFLKLAFYPLTRQAAISMNKMKKLQPEMNKIREKFKDDPQRMQQEIMRFMSVHKVNPMKGCLPILPQIPVFFAFYRVLSTSIELRHAPFFAWIQDLSSADPYFITPLLLGVAMFLQQKLTPTSGLDKAQERIMMMLPIFFTVMMLTLPAGMVLYMLTNTIISIAQQQWLNRRLQ